MTHLKFVGAMVGFCLLWLALVLVITPDTPKSSTEYEHKGAMWNGIEYKIVEKTIDSCEYIIIFGSGSRNIIHKANCSNPCHKPIKP